MRHSPQLAFLLVLLSLVIVDGLFVAAFILYGLDVLGDPRFLISVDGGYAEMFQYAKALTSGVLLFIAARKQKAGLFGLWGIFCFYIFVDDKFRIHERVGGEFLGSFLGGAASGYHLGQLIFALFISLLFLGPLISFWREAGTFARLASLGLIACFALLAAASVGVDLIHGLLTPDALEPLAIIVEEGGEHLALSLLLWWSLWLALKPEHLNAWLTRRAAARVPVSFLG